MNSPVPFTDIPAVNRLLDDCITECERVLSNCLPEQHISLNTAWQHQCSAKGKRSRMFLALNNSLQLGLTPEQSTSIAIACELVHQASLVHDDLMDADTYRNGKTTVWHNFGSATAICLGDSLLVEAVLRIASTPGISSPVTRALITLLRDSIHAAAEGQIEDCDTEKLQSYSYVEYCSAVRKKSGALFAMPVLAAMIVKDFSDNDLQCAADAFAEFGIAYQLLDDIKDQDTDKNKRLNGYWVLAQQHDNQASAALYAAVIQHLALAEAQLATLPASLQQSFNAMRNNMLLKLPELKAII